MAYHVAVSRERARCFLSKMTATLRRAYQSAEDLISPSYMASARLNRDESVPVHRSAGQQSHVVGRPWVGVPSDNLVTSVRNNSPSWTLEIVRGFLTVRT